jgi:hypothetical protein
MRRLVLSVFELLIGPVWLQFGPHFAFFKLGFGVSIFFPLPLVIIFPHALCDPVQYSPHFPTTPIFGLEKHQQS